MKLRILVTVIVLALVAGVVYRVQHQDEGDQRKGQGGDRAIGVRTVAVAERDFPRVIELPGTLEAVRQVEIVAQVGGTVLRQHVEEGAQVRTGQILFELDARPALARIAQSRAALAGARAETAEAENRVERLAPLMQSGYISRQEFDEAKVALEALRARVETARAELEAARLDADYAQIRSPIDGVVGRIQVRRGSLVQAEGDPLTTILAPGALDVRASVAQQDWPALAAARGKGKVLAEIALDADRSVRAEGELAFVDARIDPATGTLPIKVSLTSPAPAMLSGQGVRVRLHLGVLPAARVVPEAALQHGQQGTYVYVVRDGAAALETVKPLQALDGELAVEGRLEPGDRVLIEIPQRLKVGSKVRLEGEKAKP